MQKHKKLIVWSLILFGVYYAVHKLSPHPHWNYRMTVTVETPEGIKTGSAVREISREEEIRILPQQGGVHEFVSKGQAVVVDLAQRGLLFALMRGIAGSWEYSHEVATQKFPQRGKTPVGTKVVLEPLDYPMFIHFRNLNDPSSVENVLKAVNCCQVFDLRDDASEMYGSGVKIKTVTIEVTDAAAEVNIEKYLPWLPKVMGHNLLGDNVCWTSDPAKLNSSCVWATDFEVGEAHGE